MPRGTVNKMTLVGLLGRDPDVHTTAGNSKVVRLNIATNEIGPKDGEGKNTLETEWHRVVLFGRLAENAEQYLKKGSRVYIEGKLKTNKWQDGNGVDRYSTDIVGNVLEFMGGGSNSAARNESQASPAAAPAQNAKPENNAAGQQGSSPQPTSADPAPQTQSGTPSNFYDFDDDIPF